VWTGLEVLQEVVDMSDQGQAAILPPKCSKSRPCNRWRVCHFCARRRQAKIADAVANLADRVGNLRWHILYPNQQGADALRAVRANWLEAAAPEGAVWTVEQSRKTGTLHCNIITPAETLHTPTAAAYWQQTITGNVRNVGAYIAKREQMPDPAAYSGRLYGTAGQLWSILTNQKQYPAVAAAAAQYAIDSHTMLEHAASLKLDPRELQRRKWAAEAHTATKAKEKTKDEYRTIASRWLPDLLDWKEQNRPKSQLEITRAFMQREGE